MNRFDLKLKDHRSPCDVTLVVDNGIKEFKAHRHVLSEASSFFEKLFNSNMKESREEVVRLEMLTESQMADILEFIYTGSIETLTQEKAEELIAVADYLLLESLKNISQKVLEQNLSTSNCVPYYYRAVSLCAIFRIFKKTFVSLINFIAVNTFSAVLTCVILHLLIFTNLL